MRIITLTTDLGLKDQYVAAIKGQILSQVPDVQIIDITHDVRPFDISQAAYFLNNVYHDFPEGTVHFLGVDSLPEIKIDNTESNLYPLVMKLKGQYFVGCDNGLFSLLDDYEEAEVVVRIDDFSSEFAMRYPTKHIYVPTMLKLVEGMDIKNLGEEMDEIRKVFTTRPIVETDLIKGQVIHIDKYGNVVANISEKLFNEEGRGNPFTIYFRHQQYFIEKISKNYNEVPTGEKLALFNANGFLEIAINKGVHGNGGGAGSLLGLGIGDVIRMEFHPKGSKDSIDDLFPQSHGHTENS